MTPTLSVVIVSRGRPGLLARALTGLEGQRGAAFEVIVVADPAGIAAAAPWAGRIGAVPFDRANISAARNAGIAASGGEVIAFLDDDAVPEPTWARRLLAPFAEPSTIAATGTVLGRDGISVQWPFRWVDREGRHGPMVPPGATLPPEGRWLRLPHRGRAVKTEGTNMALRRSALAEVGGFDEAIRFYADETELNLRLAALRRATALVPGAVVHHGFAPSERRRADRAPLDLTEIAASTAVLARRHGGDATRMAAALGAEQRARMARHLIAGRAEPRDLRARLAEIDAGWDDGMARDLPRPPPPGPAGDVLAFGPRAAGRPAFLWGRDPDRLREEAREARRGGRQVTALLLRRGWRRHRVRFEDGVWWQEGGRLGRSDRDRAPAAAGWSARAAEERRRVAALRDLDGE
ncbi:MAG: glycosyltransferase family 2 protein [Hasllibacter sp.]